MTSLTERHRSDDGYRLWLRYELVDESQLREAYRRVLGSLHFPGASDTLRAAREELEHALRGLLGTEPHWADSATTASFLIGTPSTSSAAATWADALSLAALGSEGFLVRGELSPGGPGAIFANSDLGLLYGVFALLRALQTRSPLTTLNLREQPKLAYRMLNHWDNLNRTVERGYAGASLWDWHKLPHYVAPRYIDYARANASLGINATVLTNVNANARVLTEPYLLKVKALADVFRPYGIRIFLTARFNAPSELDQLETSDPLDQRVIDWWSEKVRQIYAQIPDFGGFLVKANSEGQPGPQDFGRSQAEGANLLARALEPHAGIVVWRAFVYDAAVPEDRHKQAYDELVPLDGQFHAHACVQTKNGPIDFQPREPFHPLFGAMPKTPMFLEFQITQEYLGCATHLVYLGPLFKETLDADTHTQGPGSTVASIVSGSFGEHRLTGMAGVSNIGDERNWCGHPFAAANWYAFGRLAWDPELSAAGIADEWLRMTFTNDAAFVATAKGIMLDSREAAVEYMTPLGLHHLMAESHHYGPGPWVTDLSRDDWTATYYHRADAGGIGFDRTKTGSNALGQYAPAVQRQYENPETCPENLLLWFHRIPWDHRMQSGRSLWDELCWAYSRGVEHAHSLYSRWLGLQGAIDPGRFDHVRQLLEVQLREAHWWRNACLLYFQTFSGRPLPEGLEKLEGTLEAYRAHRDYYVPGI